MVGQQIDRDKLRAAFRRRRSEYFSTCGRRHHASARIQAPQTDSTLSESGRASSGRLRLDGAGKESLFADVEAFQKANLTGKYYQAFAVNSGDYTEKSSGTLAWTADCRRLLERCVAQAEKEDPAAVCQAFEVIFSLLSQKSVEPDRRVR